MQRPAVRLASQIAESGLAAYARETDTLLAEPALAANIKLLETLLEVDADNPRLLLQVVQALAGYTYAFVETHLEAARGHSAEQVALHTRRAQQLYQRGMGYGFRLLSLLQHADWSQAPAMPLEQFDSLVQRLDQKAVPALFWTSFCWGGWLNLERTELEAVTMWSQLQSVLSRLLRLDETYFYGMPHVLQAVLHSSLPAWMGGNPVQAQHHFARAATLSHGRLLLIPLLEARYAAVQTQDRQRFTERLCTVLRTSETVFPEQALLNTVAKHRAALLLRRGDSLFLEPGQGCPG
jgi:hypothetical protein